MNSINLHLPYTDIYDGILFKHLFKIEQLEQTFNTKVYHNI